MSAVKEAFYRYLGRFLQPSEQDREQLDLTPLEVPFDVERPETMEEMIRRYVRTEVSRSAEADGDETFDEADDFDVEDEESPFLTHHEVEGMSELELREQADLLGYELTDGSEPTTGGEGPKMAARSSDTAAGPPGEGPKQNAPD